MITSPFPNRPRRFAISAPVSARAFTLVELLAVIAIILIMFSLIVPAMVGIKKANDVTKAAYDITGTLEQARAYAMGNDTWVYVGFTEVDITKPQSANPQVT